MSKLIVSGLSKNYKNRTVVSNVDFNAHCGEIVGLLGPNGAGKTSMFYMILGLVRPSDGRIHLDDVDITNHPIQVRASAGIGYLPQESTVFQTLSVADNIRAILELQDLSNDEQEEKLLKLLSEFKLEKVRDNFGISLSGGEKRRLEIARVLACSVKFILLDEPFAGVDPISIQDIKDIISYLSKKGIGVIITDHNVRETLDICDRAYILNNGKILSHGAPEEVIENKDVKRVYLGDFYQQ